MENLADKITARLNEMRQFLQADGGDLEIVKARYSGAIPAKVLRRFTRHVKRLAESGALFPACASFPDNA